MFKKRIASKVLNSSIVTEGDQSTHEHSGPRQYHQQQQQQTPYKTTQNGFSSIKSKNNNHKLIKIIEQTSYEDSKHQNSLTRACSKDPNQTLNKNYSNTEFPELALPRHRDNVAKSITHRPTKFSQMNSQANSNTSSQVNIGINSVKEKQEELRHKSN